VLRRTDPNRHRPFRTPGVAIIAPLAIVGCLYLFFSLSGYTLTLFFGWAIIGLIVYFLYSRRHSNIARGIIEVPELAPEAPQSVGVPPMPGAPAPPSSRDD
jgi:APA family basic amino acid/polyamine antiporter